MEEKKDLNVSGGWEYARESDTFRLTEQERARLEENGYETIDTSCNIAGIFFPDGTTSVPLTGQYIVQNSDYTVEYDPDAIIQDVTRILGPGTIRNTFYSN